MKERISQLEEQLKKLNIRYKYLQKTANILWFWLQHASNIDKYNSVEKDALEFLAGYLAFKSKKSSLKTDIAPNE